MYVLWRGRRVGGCCGLGGKRALKGSSGWRVWRQQSVCAGGIGFGKYSDCGVYSVCASDRGLYTHLQKKKHIARWWITWQLHWQYRGIRLTWRLIVLMIVLCCKRRTIFALKFILTQIKLFHFHRDIKQNVCLVFSLLWMVIIMYKTCNIHVVAYWNIIWK